ncbi:hypothetical protein V502_02085, partial [Pseudogymnoascus sp. VKM F-4520 (FW-2644)]
MAALKEAKLRGRGAGTQQRLKTKVQRLRTLLPSTPRLRLTPPHYTAGCWTDPTGGLDKETASNNFKQWWAALPPTDVTIFSDGSEQHPTGNRKVGYGTAAPCNLGMASEPTVSSIRSVFYNLQKEAQLSYEPTVSGIRSVFYDLRKEAQLSWWAQSSTKLSNGYKKWNLEYRVTPLPELDLPRATLHRFLSIRSSHGDFSWYHTKFAHEDAKLLCSCSYKKTPEHI